MGLPDRGTSQSKGTAFVPERGSGAGSGGTRQMQVVRKEDGEMGLERCLSPAAKGPRESGREGGILSIRPGTGRLQPDSTHGSSFVPPVSYKRVLHFFIF